MQGKAAGKGFDFGEFGHETGVKHEQQSLRIPTEYKARPRARVPAPHGPRHTDTIAGGMRHKV